MTACPKMVTNRLEMITFLIKNDIFYLSIIQAIL